MKQYLIDSGNGHPATVTEEHLILACDRGDIDRNARVASYAGVGSTNPFQPICSFPEFRKLIETHEADLERRRLLKVEKIRSVVGNPLARLIAKHVGRFVHVNYSKPDARDTAWLSDVNDAYLTLQVEKTALLYVPLIHILHIVEEGASVTLRIAQIWG